MNTPSIHHPAPGRPIDPLLQRRLEELIARKRPITAKRVQPSSGAARPTAAKAGRRTKPARASKLAALGLSVASTAALTGLFARQDAGAEPVAIAQSTSAVNLSAVATTPTTVAAVDSTATTVAGTAAATTVATAQAAAGAIADGTYVGGVSTNRWGPVQVQVVYSGGQLVDVGILQYPDADTKSVQINQRALPTLVDSAIAAQSADVSTVSGATYTSQSYRASLQSAIDAAKAASGVSVG